MTRILFIIDVTSTLTIKVNNTSISVYIIFSYIIFNILLKLSNKDNFNLFFINIIPIVILTINPNIIDNNEPPTKLYPILYIEFISGTLDIKLIINPILKAIIIFFSLLHIIFIFIIILYKI